MQVVRAAIVEFYGRATARARAEDVWRQASGVRQTAAVMIAVQALTWVAAAQPAESSSKAGKNYTSESIAGKVVWLAAALRERFGIATDDDVAESVVALETPEGRLHPVLKEARGRCFYTDERLREIDVELLVRRYDGSPMVQVVRVYTVKPDGKYELDYWCDVCSIAMYELKPCECCQGTTRLRERLVEKRPPPR